MADGRIGKYTIVGEIGTGAMGVVYKAVDPYIGRTVAIKTIRFDILTNAQQREEAQKRFLREAQSAGNLSHPNIVTIYDVGEDQGLTYIAMEYVEGQSLEDVLAAQRPWDPAAAVNLIVQIAEGLDNAHRKGIVHRDIKPGNILVDREGRPKIVDFGIARIASSNLTQTSMVLGTPFYMAPEQVAGKKVDHRADIFALGAIFYEILSLQKPFGGDTLTTVIYKIMSETPPPLAQVAAGVPDVLEAIVQKALAKDPEARYLSCRDLINDLRSFAASAGYSLEAGEAAVAVPAAPPAGRKPKKAATPIPASAEAFAVPNRRPLLIVLGLMLVVVAAVVVTLLFMKKGPSGPLAQRGGGAALSGQPADQPTTAPPQPAPSKTSGEPSGTGGQPEKKPPTIPTKVAAETPPPEAKKVEVEPVHPEAGREPPPAKEKAEPAKIEPSKTERAKPLETVVRRGETRAARVVRRVEPEYPDLARQARIEGEVSVQVTIGPSGRIERAIVVKGVALLDEAALKAVRQWTFEPALQEGVPVPSILTFTLPFSLGETPSTTRVESNKPTVTPIPSKESGKPATPETAARGTAAAEAAVAAELGQASEALSRKSYREAVASAKRVLAANPASTEARSILTNATIQLAPVEIKNLIDQYVLSLRVKQSVEFYRLHAAPALFARVQKDLEAIMAAYGVIQATALNISLDLREMRYPTFRARVAFDHVVSGVSRQKGVRETLFNGRYTWQLELRNDAWVILEITYQKF
jgi:serine/threonine-protein kinase